MAATIHTERDLARPPLNTCSVLLLYFTDERKSHTPEM